jgi:hypothetical protein
MSHEDYNKEYDVIGRKEMCSYMCLRKNFIVKNVVQIIHCVAMLETYLGALEQSALETRDRFSQTLIFP